MIQAELMKNDVFDARMKIKRRIQWYSGTKMTKKCVKIAYRSETVEKKKKSENGQSNASARHLTYMGQSPRTQMGPHVRKP